MSTKKELLISLLFTVGFALIFIIVVLSFSGCTSTRAQLWDARDQYREDLHRDKKCHCVPAYILKDDQLLIKYLESKRKHTIVIL